MKKLILILTMAVQLPLYGQIRPFDNSKAILPWIYNPSASTFIHDYQPYFGYDGRGTSNFTPQSFVAGIRIPLMQKRIDAPKSSGRRSVRNRTKVATAVAAAQVLNTTQSLYNTTTVQVSYAHRVALNERMTLALGMGLGIYNADYDYNALVYMDPNDPLLNQSDRLFGLHLNAGFTFTLDRRLFVNLAAPYLLRDKQANFDEIILRVGYPFYLGRDMVLTAAANLDTYNHNLIYGADIQVQWKEMISLLIGGDRYKYQAGVLFQVAGFALGYTYGQNFQPVQGQLATHQISLFGNVPF